MLKLEKTSDSAHVTIQIREKDNLLSGTFLRALAIALAIHCGAVLLFHVTPFSFGSTFLFPPIHVQSETPLIGVSVVVPEVEEEMGVAPPPLPLAPSFDWAAWLPDSPLIRSTAGDLEVLEGMEKLVWPKWELPLSIQLEEPRIRLFISGDLAEWVVASSDPLLLEMRPLGSDHDASHITYRVLLDGGKGEIFWFERIESSGKEESDRLSEQILLNLRFAPEKTLEPVQGILTFVIL